MSESETDRRGSKSRRPYSTGDADLDRRLTALVDELGTELAPPDARLTFELLVTAVRMAREPLSRLDRKLINASLKAMRYAFKVFSKYRDRKKVSVFGSSRTKPDDPEYRLAMAFGRRIAQAGWMVVTGAGPVQVQKLSSELHSRQPGHIQIVDACVVLQLPGLPRPKRLSGLGTYSQHEHTALHEVDPHPRGGELRPRHHAFHLPAILSDVGNFSFRGH